MRLTDRLAPLQGNLRAKAPEPRIIPFGEWLPDLPAFGNPGVTEAKNVLAGAQSYLPMKGLDPQTSGTFNARVRGAWAGPDSSGDVFAYVGTASKLYEVRNSVITDRSGATYATATANRWEAVRYGGKVLFTNLADPVQSLTVGAAANFADHFTSTAKPKARHIGVIGDFLVLGFTNGARNRVQWSAIGDSTDMDQDAQTQSDAQDIVQASEITGVVSGIEYGLAFSPEGVFRLTYVGSPIIFDITQIELARGTTIPGSIVTIGRQTFYWASEGIYVCDGTQSTPVGHNRVDSWLLGQLDTANKNRVSSGIDFANETIYWSFPGEDSLDGVPDKILLYNYANNRFTYADLTLDFIGSVQTQSYTLEQMDFALLSATSLTVSGAADNGSGLIRIEATGAGDIATGSGVVIEGVTGTTEANGAWFVAAVDSTHFDLQDSSFSNAYVSGGTATPGDIDNYTSESFSLDSGRWKGGEYRLAGFASDLKFSYFTGSNLTATIETAEGQLSPGRVSIVEDARPLVDGTATVAIGSRNILSDSVAYTDPASKSAEGNTSQRKNARYHRFKTVITGDWTHAQGLEVQTRPMGRRHG